MSHNLRGVTLEFAELSDPGRDPSKQVNEDAAGNAETALGFVAVVCDGMGGHVGGKLASNTAIRTILSNVRSLGHGTSPAEALRGAISHAARAVYEVGGDTPIEMRPGSTCVAVLLHEGRAEVGHVGDSRAYLIRDQVIRRLTRDHSMVQQMVDAGVITAEQASGHPDANRITRALGMLPEVEVELAQPSVPLHVGDLILLCSDGLTDLVEDKDINAVVREWLGSGIAFVCQRLVEVANACGGYDNITVQILRVLELKSQLKPTVVEETSSSPNAADSLPTAPEPPIATGGTHRMPSSDVASPSSRLHPKPALTLIEESTDAMGAPILGAGPARPGPPAPGTRLSFPPRRRGDSRLLMLVALGIAALVMVGVAIWWLVVGNSATGVPALPPLIEPDSNTTSAPNELAGPNAVPRQTRPSNIAGPAAPDTPSTHVIPAPSSAQ